MFHHFMFEIFDCPECRRQFIKALFSPKKPPKFIVNKKSKKKQNAKSKRDKKGKK